MTIKIEASCYGVLDLKLNEALEEAAGQSLVTFDVHYTIAPRLLQMLRGKNINYTWTNDGDREIISLKELI